MKPLTKFALTAVALVCLSASDAQAGAQCIEVGPDLRGFDSMLPNEEAVRQSTNQNLTGSVARLVAYVERHDGAAGGFEASPRDVFLFATDSGRFVVRFSEPWPKESDEQ